MTTAFWVCVIGAVIYVFTGQFFADRGVPQLAELGKWAFIVGLAAWFLGH